MQPTTFYNVQFAKNIFLFLVFVIIFILQFVLLNKINVIL